MRTAAKLAALALVANPVAVTLAQTAEPTADSSSVEQKLVDQEQRIKILERKLELAGEATSAAATSTPVVKSAATGFSLSSADGKNVLRLRGTLNVDGRYFKSFDDTANLTNSVPGTSAYNSADTVLLRKVRPSIEGTVNGIYDFRFLPDFGGGKTVIQETYVAARLKPWAVVTVGKFKGPIGLERLQTEQYNRFVELGFPSSLVPNREIGLQFSGNVLNNVVNYSIGYFNGVVDGGSSDGNPTADADSDGKRESEARVFVLPFVNSGNFYLRGLGFGLAGSTGTKLGSATLTTIGTVAVPTPPATTGTSAVVTAATSSWLPSYRSAAQQTFFSYRGDTASTTTVNEAVFANGKHSRVAPQAYYYYGGLGVIGEYVETQQAVTRHVNATTDVSATLKNKAWQVATSYLLTGEEATYGTAVTPRSNFALGQPGWGAWEIAARYQKLQIDDAAFDGGSASFANPATAVSTATGYSLAVNWYLNQNVRWTVEYDRTSFEGGAGTTAAVTDRKDESAYVTRFALSF